MRWWPGTVGRLLVALILFMTGGAGTAVADMAGSDTLAWDYYLGRNGHGQDYARAMQLFQQGVEAGDALSHYGVATLYSRGLGVELDYLRARYHYEKAAEGGVRRAYYNLGVFYHKGFGVIQSNSRARMLFGVAAKMGEPHAYYTLGIFDEEGLDGPVDLDSARQWYHKAAAEKVVGAQGRLERLMPGAHVESSNEE